MDLKKKNGFEYGYLSSYNTQLWIFAVLKKNPRK